MTNFFLPISTYTNHFARPLARGLLTFLVVLALWNLSTRIGCFINPSTVVRSLTSEVFDVIEESLFALNKRKYIDSELLAVNDLLTRNGPDLSMCVHDVQTRLGTGRIPTPPFLLFVLDRISQ